MNSRQRKAQASLTDLSPYANRPITRAKIRKACQILSSYLLASQYQKFNRKGAMPPNFSRDNSLGNEGRLGLKEIYRSEKLPVRISEKVSLSWTKFCIFSSLSQVVDSKITKSREAFLLVKKGGSLGIPTPPFLLSAPTRVTGSTHNTFDCRTVIRIILSGLASVRPDGNLSKWNVTASLGRNNHCK